MAFIKISSQIITTEDSKIEILLDKIDSNKMGILFVVDQSNRLKGSITDGDIRRWILRGENLSGIASEVMNRNPVRGTIRQSVDELRILFKVGIDCIPVVDEMNHLIRIFIRERERIYIDGKIISNEPPIYVIAEIGNNHQGDITIAKKLVDAAVDAGADCAKFQMRQLTDLYYGGAGSRLEDDLGAQYTKDLLEKYQLTNDELFEMFDYCKQVGITPLCTPWDIKSIELLEQYNMPAYKVASADFTNFELLQKVADTNKPMFCSTGMSSEREISQTVAFLDSVGANYVLLHCNSTYPTPFKDVNIKYLKRLKDFTSGPVGYSGHERGFFIPVASVCLGASVIEKHLTLDRELEGSDHKVSLLPAEFASMIQQIRSIELALGDDKKPREISQGELLNRSNLAKSIVARFEILPGERIRREMLEIKSPGQGLQPNRIEELIGRVARRHIKKGNFLFESDISGIQVKKEHYIFKRPYGVPVRYHDFKSITDSISLDFVEFHLSYNDLEVDFTKILPSKSELGLVVHCPELFKDDHIIDLGALDNSYRKISIFWLNKVIEETKKLKNIFYNVKKPVLVLNAGGWCRNRFFTTSEKQERYELIQKSLNSADHSGVQIAIQTMPPFPWHFGGQSYHNLFLDPDEIVTFCLKNPQVKVCLDVSHSMMACNYYGLNFETFLNKVLPHTVHLHIVDAKGNDGEGVEIGEGDVDFSMLARSLENHAKNIPFVPEVWQGHKNNGEGFWKALAFLEGSI